MKIQRVLLMLGLICIVSLSSTAQSETQSFSLEEAKKYALEHSYQSRMMANELKKAKFKVKETIGIGLPQVSGSASYQNYIKQPVQLVPAEFFGGTAGEFAKVIFGTKQNMGVAANVNQLLFDGSYIVGLQASNVYLQLTENDVEKTEIEVKNMVTQAYGAVLISERNLEILKNNKANLEKSLKETEEVFKNGFLEEQDVEQLNLLLSTATTSAEQAAKQLEVAKNQFKIALGLEITTEVILSDDLTSVTNNSKIDGFAEKEFKLTDNHIEFKSILTQEKAAKLQMKLQQSGYLPRLTANMSFQQNAFANEFNFFGSDGQWFSTQYFGLNLQVPIFGGLTQRFKVQQAKLDYQNAQLAKKQVEQQLIVNADNAKSDYAFALNNYNTIINSVDLAERIYAKNEMKYKEGMISSMELTQANNQLLEMQGNFIQASYQLINAKTALDKALNNY